MEDGTYNQDRQPVTHESGFQVGLWTKTIDAGDTERVEHLINEITGGDLMFDGYDMWAGEWGIWTDSNTGEVFIEPCIWLPSLEVALAMGALYEQRTVWDWVLMQEVEV